MNESEKHLETKAGNGQSPAMQSAVAEMMQAFEAYRETNDERLEALENNRGDIILDEKLARIDAALDAQKNTLNALALKAARPALGGDRKPVAYDEHKSAFEAYVRSGDEDGLKGLSKKALAISTNAGADGGYLVPIETEAMIGKRLSVVSPIRSIASVRQVSSNVYRKPFATNGFATGWAAETASRTQSNTPTLDDLDFPTAELYAMPAATQALLDDAIVDIDAWIAEEVETAFAEQEGTAFVSGNGTNKPKGFLAETTVAEASWTWGNIGKVITGVDGGISCRRSVRHSG
jgi:HK97 family phage major capsid protein